MTVSAFNTDLKELHGFLAKQVQVLVERLGQAKTVDEVRAIQTEITELNHRVTVVGNLLFSQQTAALTRAMDKVRAEIGNIEEATKKIEDIARFLKTLSSFLSLVDKVIDTAKLITPLGAA